MPGYLAIVDWNGDDAPTFRASAVGTAAPPPLAWGSLRVFGDVRLDNEAEIAGALDGAIERGLPLVARAYAAWGAGFAGRLIGDFAVVIVDLARRVVCAARDPFGVRALAYRQTTRGMAFGNDVGALASLGGERSGIDDRAIYDFLTGVERSHTRTFFREVQRLTPGHVLRADRTTTTVERYWFPPTRGREETRAACLDEFAARFKTAVSDRMHSATPVLAHVSGGLDSSSIACVADALTTGRPPLHFVSAHFAEADERSFVASLRARLRTPIETFEAVPQEDDDDPLDRGSPRRYPLAAMTTGIASIAARTGARVILSGLGGDELLFERGIYRDLAADARWLTLWRETGLAERYSTRARSYYLADALRPRTLPRALRRAVRLVRSLRPAHARWLRAPAPQREESPPANVPAGHVWLSETQRFTWDWLSTPGLVAGLEAEDSAAARDGLEMRYPFLDRRLVELVLATAYEHRVPGGRMKVLLRDALGSVLPEAVRERAHVTVFDAVITAAIARKARFLSDAIDEGPWRSERFADRDGVRRALRRFLVAPVDCAAALSLWDIASLEHWLRARD